MRDWLILAAIIGLVCLGVINRPVEVYVWARDVSVCASVAVDPHPNEQR